MRFTVHWEPELDLLWPFWFNRHRLSWSLSRFIVLRLKVFFFVFFFGGAVDSHSAAALKMLEAWDPAGEMRKAAWEVFELWTRLTAWWKCSHSVSDLWAPLKSCMVLLGLSGFKRPNLTFIWVCTFSAHSPSTSGCGLRIQTIWS